MKTNLSDPNAVAAAAATVLRTHPIAVLATSDIRSQPWAVPVHQVTMPDGSLNWRSSRSARHSLDLATNAKAMMVLFSATNEQGEIALYLEGAVSEVVDAAAIQTIVEVRYANTSLKPTLADFSGENEYRFYRFIPTAAWLNDDAHEKTSVDMKLLLAALTAV
ncbi:pyridoxamine 5'-phosphate oxidase family protein [Candidatus Saccharibacteria bacterium]|nr:pyridoxamine 5'-phosphate oxidase family protein [Candidatus Saccharibacteria bacterium]